MRILKHVVIWVAAIGAALVVVAGVYAIARRSLNGGTAPAQAVAACPARGAVHQVAFSRGAVVPRTLTAKRCDTLTITNDDDQIRLVAFGPHDRHVPYDGVTEQALSRYQSFTIVLNQAGSFSFHDHLDDKAIGYFTVVP